ncbi:MAG: BrnA antitoxin family protein [Magnetococcus sp. YQC-5]
MNGKSIDISTAWVDPDDAPELTEEWLDKVMEHGVWKMGELVVSRTEGMDAFRKQMRHERPTGNKTKVATTIRYDAEVIAAF